MNLRRIFSKQNLAENETSNALKISILNARRNRSTNANRSFKVSKFQKTEDPIKVI